MTKKIDLSSISIERIIVHDVPKHAKNDLSIQPNYSDEESSLSDGLKLFFKDKIIQALGSDKALKICFDDNSASPISYIVANTLLSNGSTVIEQSKLLAKHLFEIQVGSNAAGILVVIYGKINDSNGFFVLKLEMDQGAQLKLNPATKSYSIEEVKYLMLTQKTRIFKVAMFFSRSDFKSKFDGILMDFQINIKAKKEVQTWFIEKFLGCVAYEDPKFTTKRFYNLTRSFIDLQKDDILRTKYLQDLNSYVQKNSQTLSPKEFGDDYLTSTDHRNEYKAFLESKHFKYNSFQKDLSQIDNQVKKITIIFENDISLIGNKGTFANKVKLDKLDNGQTRAEITSKIKRVN